MEENQDFMEDGQSSFVLTDEDGNEYTFDLLDFVEYEDAMYAVLAPSEEEGAESEEEEMEIVIMRTDFDGETPIFNVEEDEELCQTIIDLFISKVDEEEDEEEDI